MVLHSKYRGKVQGGGSNLSLGQYLIWAPLTHSHIREEIAGSDVVGIRY